MSIYKKFEADPYEEDCVPDPRDARTPDHWVERHPEMVRLTGIHPFNCESPLHKLKESGFITPASIHYTRNHGAVPRLSWETHRLEIVADAEDEARGFTSRDFSMDELAALPHISVAATLTCAGNRRKEENLTSKTVGFSWNTTATSTAVWRGVRLRDVLLKLCNLPWQSDDEYDGTVPEERYVWMVGEDELPKGNYGTCIPLGLAMNVANDVIIAFEVNGKALPADRGFPLRMVIPGWIGGRMVKWLKRLEIRKGESTNHYHYFDNRILPPLITKEIADEQGWWMKTEYLFNELNINSILWAPFHGDSIVLPAGASKKNRSAGKQDSRPRPQQRWQASPIDDTGARVWTFGDGSICEASVPAFKLEGYAYSGGGRRVTRVEVSFDVGQTWHLTTLQVTERPNRYGKYWCWVHWSFDATPEQLATPHRWIHCRAWDESSNTQPNRITWNVMGMGNNCIFGVRVDHSLCQDGSTKLRFIHPTQEAGMSAVGWMKPDHKLPAPSSPERLQLTVDSDSPEDDPRGPLDFLEGPSSMTAASDSASDSTMSMSDFATDYDGSDDSVRVRLNEFTMDEVARHETEESAWIVVRDKVYDCTPFLKEHPGGASSILMAAGTDATEDMEAIHSPKALLLLRDHLIGRVVTKRPRFADTGSSLGLRQAPAPPKETASASTATWLQPRAWVSFTITLKERLENDMILLRFAPVGRGTPGSKEMPLGLPIGMHVMIKVKPPEQAVVIRPYTPIVLAAKHEEREEFTLLVKVYRANEHPKFPLGGKMSQALDALNVGDSVDVKGPCGHIYYAGQGLLCVDKKELRVDEISFMCGGTGITPAFRVIEAALADHRDKTVFRLVYANNRVEFIALREEIDALARQHPDRLHVFYTVSEAPKDEPWSGGVGFIDEEMTRQNVSNPSTKCFVGLCGPPPMINFACVPSLKALGFSESQYGCF